MKRIIGVVAVILGVALVLKGAASAISSKPAKSLVVKKQGYAPIVRLHEWESGRFFCSGTIISDRMLLTAAHCVAGAPRGIAIIELHDQNDRPFNPRIVVSVYGLNERADLALLEGRFEEFDKMEIEYRPQPVIDAFYKSNNNIVLCGYPWGGKLFCQPFKQPRPYIFQVQGLSFVYPGMSGGPVIDMNTGKIVAVNTAGTESTVIVSPLIEIFEALGVQAQ